MIKPSTAKAARAAVARRYRRLETTSIASSERRDIYDLPVGLRALALITRAFAKSVAEGEGKEDYYRRIYKLVINPQTHLQQLLTLDTLEI